MGKLLVATLGVALICVAYFVIGSRDEIGHAGSNLGATPAATRAASEAAALAADAAAAVNSARAPVDANAIDANADEDEFLASLPLARCSGRVVDTAGAPLPGARVVLSHSGADDVSVDAVDGTYSSGGLSPGEYTVVATLDGFVGTATAQRTLQIVPGETHAVDPLVLARPVQLRGRVVDDDGAVVAGAIVRAHPDDRAFDQGRWNRAHDPDLESTTAADGTFAFDVAPDRTWRLHALADGSDTQVFVASGANDQVVELVMPRPRALELAFVDADNEAPVRAKCVGSHVGDRGCPSPLEVMCGFEGADPMRILPATEPAPGRLRFTVRVDRGISFGIRADGYVYANSPTFLPDSATPTSQVIRLVRDHPALLRVRAIDSESRPLPNLIVALYSRDQAGCGGMEPLPHGHLSSSEVTDRDGIATFTVNSDGPFQAMVEDSGHVPSHTDWIAWDANAAAQVHELRVTGSASVRGRVVLLGAPIAANLELEFERDDGYVQSIFARLDGTFTSPSLAPGRYRLIPERRRTSPPDSRGAEFELRAGDAIARDVDLAAFGLGVIAGTLRARGSPLPGISIELDTGGTAITGADGAFVISGARAGAAAADVYRGYQFLAARSLDVAPAAITRLDLDLRISSASGRVDDGSDGEALVNASITLTPLPATLQDGAPNPLESMGLETETGPDGVWRIAAIECGRYLMIVRADADELAPVARVIEIGEKPTRIDSTLPVKAAVRVLLPESARGDDASAYVEVTRADVPWHSVSNEVVDDDGSISVETLAPGVWIVRLYVEPAGGTFAVFREFGTVTLESGATRDLDATK